MTAMSFSHRQRTNPHKRKVLLGVGLGVGGDQSHFLFVKEEILTRKNPRGGGMAESNEFFSSSKMKSSRGKNPRVGGRWRSSGRISQNAILLKFQ